MHAARYLTTLFLILAFSPIPVAKGEITLPKTFTKHMVLQREMRVPVWGKAKPGEKLEIRFRDQLKIATVDAQGDWKVYLDPLQAGGPDTLSIGDKIIDDVLVGDVWLGSGQSNMAGTVANYIAGDPNLAEKAAKSYPRMRLLNKGANDVWLEANPTNNQTMSALLFSLGVSLHSELDVPIGLMVGAVGGTPSGYWLSEEMYRRDVACAEAVKKFAPTYPFETLLKNYQVAKQKHDKEFAAWKLASEAAKKQGKKADRPPRAPTPVGKPGETNTGTVGQLFEAYIRPYVGYGIKGVLWDQGESRTNIVGVDQVTLMGALINGWRRDWGQGDFPFLYVQKPSGGGCAWDAGMPETNKAEPFTELPQAITAVPAEDYSHAVFAQIMRYPKTYMVISTDLGSGIHPTNKSGYGSRAARVALAAAYGKSIEWLGPMYDRHEIQGGKVIIHYTHVGQGLAYRHADHCQGFQIAGADKKFVWAKAEIVGNTVVVSHPDIPQPAAVRYAWSTRFPWANLFNRDGLPAQPFRTDTWNEKPATVSAKPATPSQGEASKTVSVQPKPPVVVSDPTVAFRQEKYKQVGDVELMIDIFEPKQRDPSKKYPAIVFFFGGSWVGGGPPQFHQQCEYLASRGMIAMAADYRVRSRQQTTPAECVKDGKSALRWIRANAARLGIDEHRIAAGGGSAGGHVAAAVATTTGFIEAGEDTSISSMPDALVLYNPVFDNGPGGFGHQAVKDFFPAISPLHNLKPGLPPTIIFLGTEDKLIPVATAKSYQSKMQENGDRCDLHLYEGQPHGFFNYSRPDRAWYYRTLREVDRFLNSLGWLQGEPKIADALLVEAPKASSNQEAPPVEQKPTAPKANKDGANRRPTSQLPIALEQGTGTIQPDANGLIRLTTKEDGGIPLPHDQEIALTWRASVPVGVYNVGVHYVSSRIAPTLRMTTSDDRQLQDVFRSAQSTSDKTAERVLRQSLGPLPFREPRDVEFRLSRHDLNPGNIRVVSIVLAPIGGTLPSLTSTPNRPAGDAPAPQVAVNPADEAEMIWIPAGDFIMGGLNGKDDHRVFVDGFWMYKTPVTVQQYRRYCERTGVKMPSPPEWGWFEDHPIVNVSWYDAVAYAKWAGARLPTEAEWEKAARGTDGRVLPWGNEFDSNLCQSPRDRHGYQGTMPVGSFPKGASPYGCLDMCGNVWQWCSTRMAPYPYRADDGREELETKSENERRIYRGGGWVMNSWSQDWTILHRGNFFPKYWEHGKLVELRRSPIGFRCAVSRTL